MRLSWTFFAGFAFAGFVLLATLPVLGGVALAGWWLRGPPWTVLSGQSYFAVRDQDGRMAGRATNIGFTPLSVLMPTDPRPRRLLMRLEVISAEFSAAIGEGRVRLDAWPIDEAKDLRQPPLYTVVVPGRAANLDPDGMLMVEHAGSRRSAYSLVDGHWLFDADVPLAAFSTEGERRRYVALAQADDDMPSGSVAVITFASSQRPIRRLLLAAQDPSRGRFLRGSISMTRPVARLDDSRQRQLEVPLASGTLRIAITGDDIDLANAQVPAGLWLAEMKAWGGGRK